MNSRIRWAPPPSRPRHLHSPLSCLSPSPTPPPALQHISIVTLPAPPQGLHPMRWPLPSPPIGTPTKLLSCIALLPQAPLLSLLSVTTKSSHHFCTLSLWRPSCIRSVQLNKVVDILVNSARFLSSQGGCDFACTNLPSYFHWHNHRH